MTTRRKRRAPEAGRSVKRQIGDRGHRRDETENWCGMSETEDLARLFDLNSKHALITGAGGGIGMALCRGFAVGGAKIACLDINAQIAQSAVNVVEQGGSEGIPLVCDVSQPEQMWQVSAASDRRAA